MNIIQHTTERVLRKIGLLEKKPYISQQDRRLNLLTGSFDFFHSLSKQTDVKSVRFDSDAATISFKDERHFLIDPHNKAGRMFSVPFTGTFEPMETHFARNTVRRGDVCFDIGANFGWFTILLSQLAGDKGQVHAFEPIPDTIDILRRNVRLNQADNVRICTHALDDLSAVRDIYVPDVGVSGSFALHHYRETFDAMTVKTTTLDQYVEQHNIKQIDFLKADIEGAEFAALKGGEQSIERFHPTLMVEVQADSTQKFGYEPDELFDWLTQRGYRAYCLADDGKLCPADDQTTRNAHYNFAFIANTQSQTVAA